MSSISNDLLAMRKSGEKELYLHDVNLTRKKANNGVQLAPI
jgi:hypothetical protein